MRFFKYSFFIFILLSIFLTGCEPVNKKSTKKDIKDGVVKQYRAGNILKNEITYKDGKRNGIAKTYYKDGSLRQKIEYLNDKKNGEAITYYENGKTYQITPYQEGEIEGVRKKFRQNGKLMAEIPYQNSLPCKGLKEYLLDGSVKKMYPKIQFRPIDNILRSGIYELEISISDGSKNVDFYINTALSKGDCLVQDFGSRSNSKPGVLSLSYGMPVGTFIMEEIQVLAVVKTKLGNPFITTAKYNLAIENGG